VDREIDPNRPSSPTLGSSAAAQVALEVKGRAAPLTWPWRQESDGRLGVRREGSNPPCSSWASPWPAIPLGPSRFRDKTLLAFDRKNVTAVDVDLGDGSRMTLEPERPGSGGSARPGPYRADGDLVADMLDSSAPPHTRVRVHSEVAATVTGSTSRRG